AALVNWKLNRLGRIERDILRVAVAEIHVLNSVPQRVAINEAIELAKKYGDEESASFINGVLRRAISLSKERARAEIPSSTP
ncbi:MAG: transcription antitermination factor NusB, partial [Cyanobacteria bacterium P01_F01_bin.33]